MSITKLLRFGLSMMVVALMASMLFVQGSIPYTYNKQEAGFCKNCHEMNPNVFTWQISSHNRIGCLKCHTDIELKDFTYRHWRGFFDTPIVAKTFIPNETCANCHSETREITPMQNNIVPHQLHMNKRVDCIDCHNNITHYNVSSKLIAQKVKDVSTFSARDAKRFKDNKAVPMGTCMVCHNGSKASNQCKACHREPPKAIPQSLTISATAGNS
ncbi:MAG: NapC/NirT family cytochrome c [Carboxydocellales bacterium]